MTTLSSAADGKSVLSETVTKVTEDYLHNLNGEDATNLYRQVVDEVEKPLLNVIMAHTRGNQSKAAICLGINRATLRSKLKRHGMM